jgi:arsenate reductase
VERLGILFVCLGNSCRSPMAEAIARSLGGDRVDARSAGLTPLGWVAKQTIEALHSLGFAAEGLSSKSLDAVDTNDLDIVVSLLGERGLDHIPLGIGSRREAWPIPDPFGEDEEFYLDVARQLELRIRRLLAEEVESELFLS